jgi:hypothetical protein
VSLRLRLAVQGSYGEITRGAENAVLVALKAGTADAAKAGERRLEAETRRLAGFENLANAWTSEVYPTGSRLARNPAALIYFKAQKLLEPHLTGERIRAKDGYLWVPLTGTPAAAPMRLPKGESRLSRIIRRFGEPVYVPTPRGLFVGFNVSISRAGKVGSGFTSRDKVTGEQKIRKSARVMLMFVLKKDVAPGAQIRLQPTFDAIRDDYAEMTAAALRHRLAAAASGMRASAPGALYGLVDPVATPAGAMIFERSDGLRSLRMRPGSRL